MLQFDMYDCEYGRFIETFKLINSDFQVISTFYAPQVT